MTELWLVRHGETEWSLDGRHTSFTDIPLTAHGRERAGELREFLKGKEFAAVFSSPRQRAMETCRLAGLGDGMQVENGLVEWNYGEFEGKSTKTIRATEGPQWTVWTDPIRGGESVDEVGVRVDGVIERALAAAVEAGKADPSAMLRDDKSMQDDKASGSAGQVTRVALFAHAHVLRILAARWIGRPAVDGRLFALGTGSVSVLGFERETRVIAHWNRGFEGK